MTHGWLDIATLLVAMVVAGGVAGLIAGLFGVGGGTVLVPALFYAFGVFGLGGEANLHVAIGTSLSTIITTSWRSVAAHRTHGRVDEDVLRGFMPWVGLGAVAGAIVAGLVDKAALSLVYGVFALLLAAYLGLGRESWTLMAQAPIGGLRAMIGAAMGAVSALMGIGGGAFGTAVLTLSGRPIHQAVATASGFGVAIAIPATLGFVVMGCGHDGRPPLSLGYVNVPGFVVLAALTGIVAPYGAKLAHRLDKNVLRRSFGAYLAFTAIMVVVKALG
ncbi:MAG: hypothetical protein RL186_1767 [Pseudomonadota bacterium]